jgi:anti-sigma-K factor RskA
MRQAPSGRVYEVWMQRGTSAPVPTHSLFDVPHDGSASVALPGDLHGVRVVMVTLEPAGGSPHPTSAPVITAKLD